MVIFKMFKSKRWHSVQAAFLTAVVVFCLSGTAYAAEDVSTLPHIVKWKNSNAFSDDGAYLSDTWAVDDTGVSDKKYVLVDQKNQEVLRVENYPDDLADGDTAPCEKYVLNAALVLPEGASGDVYITLENKGAEYSVTFKESDEYKANLNVYPGVYEVADVEATGDLRGTYSVSNYSQINANSDLTVSFEITNSVGDISGEAASPTDGAEDSGEDSSAAGNFKDNELLWDTVKLFVVVTVLFVILAVVKRRREKSEEMEQ